MTAPPSNRQVWLAGLVVLLVIAFVVLGAAWNGVSPQTLQRAWHHLVNRPGGPMTFRFILQPAMAALMALRDGRRDARMGRSPYLWAILTLPAERGGLLGEGLIATARIILLGIGMDAIYQAIVFRTFYPSEAAIIGIVLGFLPYLILRGPVARIARRRRSGAANRDR